MGLGERGQGESGHSGHSGHSHGSHSQGHSHGYGLGGAAQADQRWLLLALGLIVGFMAVEVVVGVLAGSLALLTDAAHMLTDAASIVLALVAARLAARPAKGHYTFGLQRAEILSAQANGLTLLLLAAWLAEEAVTRLLHPSPVRGVLVIGTALAGVAVNLAATWAMSRADRSRLNIEGAFQHILNDLYAFGATLIAGVILVVTGFDRADALASLLVVALMVRSGIGLLRDSGRILLEAAPAGLDPARIGAAMVAAPGVIEVHDLHVWTITSGSPALSAHVLVVDGEDCHGARIELEEILRGDFGVTHTTLQVDHVGDAAPADPGATVAHCDQPHGQAHSAPGWPLMRGEWPPRPPGRS